MRDKVGKVATVVYTEDGNTIIRYHQTNVVTFNRNAIRLNTNGWRTATTKVRMNQASRQYNLGFSVYQEKHEWYVVFKGEKIQFEDNMTLER